MNRYFNFLNRLCNFLEQLGTLFFFSFLENVTQLKVNNTFFVDYFFHGFGELVSIFMAAGRRMWD